MKILLHICCGPCSLYPLQALREEGMELEGFFYNPNIHPYREYLRRWEALHQVAEAEGLAVRHRWEYELEKFLARVAQFPSERCRHCYELRLEKAAREAAEGGFAAFTTTLLVSPWQKHDLIRQVAEEVAGRVGVPFLYRDFRPGYRQGQQRARELGIYRQPYCGCIYSEKERYARSRPDVARAR
ncbi:MAG: epoxyqueuosine reductase QueH [Bacillota bacterium]|nr:epoxyqueuosine reductase QueH [Bacillota bacterium]